MAQVTTEHTSLREALAQRVRGDVAVPGDPQYAGLVAGFHLAFAHTAPIAVAPVDADDVAAVVQLAGAVGVPVTALGEGHGFHYGITEGVIVRTRGLAGVEIDAADRTARIGAGTTWQEVLDAAADAGLTALAGSDGGVGAVGYVLGGGLGPLGRTYGYGADSVLSFQVVTGEGAVLEVDASSHGDLFWALRGGNHGLGIVTAMTVRLVPLDDVHGNAWYYAAADVEKVLRAWVRWSREVPQEMNSFASVIRMPDDHELPADLRGQTLLQLTHIYVGEEAEGLRLVAGFDALATPVLHEPGRVREDTLPPTVVTDAGMYLDGLDDEAIDAVLALAGAHLSYAEVPLASVGFQLLGGALSRPQGAPNAVTGRGAAYAFHIIGAEPDLVDTEIPRQIQRLQGAVARLQSSGTIPNYIGPANPPGAVEAAWVPEVVARLDEVRATYDPLRVFRNTHTR
jgi:FAD/FMN-containing dehydrogenase